MIRWLGLQEEKVHVTRSISSSHAAVPAATRQQQRELIDHQRPEGCSIRRGCEVIGLPRSSSYYYCPGETPCAISDTSLVERIGQVQDEFACYVTRELRKRSHIVNHKRVARVMREHGLGIKLRWRFVRTTDSNHDLPVFANLYDKVIPAPAPIEHRCRYASSSRNTTACPSSSDASRDRACSGRSWSRKAHE